MFRYMTDVMMWGVIVTVIACLIGIAAEGRLQHFIRVLIGRSERRESLMETLDRYDEVERPDVNWDFVGTIANPRAPLGAEPEVERSVRFVASSDPDAPSARDRLRSLRDAAREAAAKAARTASAAISARTADSAPEPSAAAPAREEPSGSAPVREVVAASASSPTTGAHRIAPREIATGEHAVRREMPPSVAPRRRASAAQGR